jgi:lysophospholipase L1-like esterase
VLAAAIVAGALSAAADSASAGGAPLPSVQDVLSAGTPTAPANITVYGDSISFGATNSAPKYLHSWPGQLRTELASAHGDAGSGFVIADPKVRNAPAGDPRWTFTGPSIVTTMLKGFHQAGVYAIQPHSSLRFTCPTGCTSFMLYTLASPSGVGKVQVDGGPVRSIRAAPSGAVNLAPLPGYPSNQYVTAIPAGSFGRHTLTLTASGVVNLYGIETRTGRGSIRVNDVAISGKSLRTLGTEPEFDDETNHAYGLPLVDATLQSGPSVVVIELGVNDWLEGYSLDTITTRLTTLINRVEADGATPVLYAPPQPAPVAQTHAGAATYTQLTAMYQQVSTNLGVPFLNHQKLYAPGLTDENAIYLAGKALGMYGDGIHPNDAGSSAMVDGYGSTHGLRAFLGL